jgi:ankyrin repeat protein
VTASYLIPLILAASVVLQAAGAGDLAGAAQRGNWAQVRLLAGVRSSVRFTQADGMTALHWAVQANQADIIALLLKSGADPNAANRYGITPLWLAATNGSSSVVQLLLKAGAAASLALPHGETALMAAARTGEPETIRVLLKAGADPNASESSQGETALMWAAAENHADAVRALIAGGADANLHAKPLNLAPMDWLQVGMVSTVLPRGGFTAVMYAARQDARDAVRALAESGANLDLQDPDGTTAIEFAIINQHYDLAALLIDKGANPNVADNTGMTAVYAAVDMNDFRSDIGRPTRIRSDRLQNADVLRLMLSHGGDPNARLRKTILARHHGFGDAALGEGATPLMRAAKGTELEAMKILVDGGADPKLAMANGSNALTLLAGTRPGPGAGSVDQIVESMRFLIAHGADPNARAARGETALHIAARQGSNGIVRALVELGADLRTTDSGGKTALDLVTEPGRNRHDDTATLLRELAAR